MSIQDIRKEHELVDIFCTLAETPSPSLHEEKVIAKIQEFCSQNNIPCTLDDYKNVYIYPCNRFFKTTNYVFITYGRCR